MDPVSELAALTFDDPIRKLSFSPDSKKFAVLAGGRIIGFQINEEKKDITPVFKLEDERVVAFSWDLVSYRVL
jgi:hypothetical protein